MIETLKMVAKVFLVTMLVAFLFGLILFSLDSRAGEIQGNRPANVQCPELGQIAEEMSVLIYKTDREHILKLEASRYPGSVKYLDAILGLVLDPPIVDGAQLNKGLTAKCMQELTKEM